MDNIPAPADLRQDAIDKLRDQPQHDPTQAEIERERFRVQDETRLRGAYLHYGQPIPQHNEIMQRADGRYCVGLDPALSMIEDPVTLAGLIDGDRGRAMTLVIDWAVKSDIADQIHAWHDVTSSNEPFWSFMPNMKTVPESLPTGDREVKTPGTDPAYVSETTKECAVGIDVAAGEDAEPVIMEVTPEPVVAEVQSPFAKVTKCVAAFDPQGNMAPGCILTIFEGPLFDAAVTGMQKHAALMHDFPDWPAAARYGYTIQNVTVVPDHHMDAIIDMEVDTATTKWKQDWLIDNKPAKKKTTKKRKVRRGKTSKKTSKKTKAKTSPKAKDVLTPAQSSE